MSQSRQRVGADSRCALARRARILLTLLTLLAVVATAAATPALAYWSSTGSGSSAALTGTLSAPTGVIVPAEAAPNIAVSWTAGTGSVAPTGYFVTRINGTTEPACGSGPGSLILTTDCTDSAVPDGTYTYVVTAVYATWTAPSSPSGTVAVENLVAVAFVVQPSETLAGAAITPALTVALQTADGGPFIKAGVSVTVTIEANPGAGTLSGTMTVLTDADGVATFDDLSISQPGIGYTLTANSAGLTLDISEPFVVLVPPILGAAQSFSVLAGTEVVNVGITTSVSGDVGVSPGTSITGFPVGSIGGDIHSNDAAAVAAQAAVIAAYDTLAALAPKSPISGDMNGLTLTPGVYYSGAALALTGTVTLDGAGDPNAVFIIQVNAAFNTAAASSVVLISGARADNVYWVVAGAAGTGATSKLSGTILAIGAITLGAGTELIGRALSRDAVTLASNTIRFTAALPPTISITGGSTATTKDTTPVIAGTSNAPASSPITVRIAGQTLTTAVGSDGTWSVTAATLIAGTYDVVARVRDPAGNGTATTQVLTVEVNPAPVNLGNAEPFAVLAGTSITNTGATTVNGDLGVSPGVLVSGFPPGTDNGNIHIGDSTAAAAQVDLNAALFEVFGRVRHTTALGDLGGRTFHIGIHRQTAAMALTGAVTLDAEGNPGAVFIFVTDAAFNTAAASNVILANGAQAANVYWVVQGAAGTGANSFLSGTILARGAITLGASTVLTGRALSRDGVTLAGNSITVPILAGLGRMLALQDSAGGSAPAGSTDEPPADPAASATVTVSSTEPTAAPPETTPSTAAPPTSSAEPTPDVTPDVTPESTLATVPEIGPEIAPETTPPADPCVQPTAETPPTSPAGVPPAETTSDVTPPTTPPAEECPTVSATPLVSSSQVTSPMQTPDQPALTPPEPTPGPEPPAPATGTGTSTEVTTS